jgi:hypothetical protein
MFRSPDRIPWQEQWLSPAAMTSHTIWSCWHAWCCNYMDAEFSCDHSWSGCVEHFAG